MTMHPSGRNIPDATGRDDNEYYATAYSETHTKCSACGADVLLPDLTDFNDDYESERCACGAVTCLMCMDVGGCGGESCDRNADREER